MVRFGFIVPPKRPLKRKRRALLALEVLTEMIGLTVAMSFTRLYPREVVSRVLRLCVCLAAPRKACVSLSLVDQVETKCPLDIHGAVNL